MKKILCMVLFSGCLASANADPLGFTIATPQFDGQIIIAGAVPPTPEVAYVQPVVYSSPVIYNAPVVYNAPVIYNPVAVPMAPPDYEPLACAVPCAPESSVQVIHFGRQQGHQQGYYFDAPR